MTFVYTNTVPNPPNLPSTDVNAMQTNTATIDSWVQRDHVGFNNADAGYHRQVHMDNQAAPALGTQDCVFYADAVGGNSWPHWRNNLGSFQMTGSASANNPSAGAANGWTFLPGGLIYQWGIFNFGAVAGVITFATANIAFPTNCFGVLLTVITNGGAPFGTMSVANVSTTSFQYTIQNQGAATGFYWSAIGN